MVDDHEATRLFLALRSGATLKHFACLVGANLSLRMITIMMTMMDGIDLRSACFYTYLNMPLVKAG